MPVVVEEDVLWAMVLEVLVVLVLVVTEVTPTVQIAQVLMEKAAAAEEGVEVLQNMLALLADQE
jgi:hypothetical protein